MRKRQRFEWWLGERVILRAGRIAKHQTASLVSRVRPVWVRLTAGIVVVGVAWWVVSAGYSEWQAAINAPRQCATQLRLPYIQFNIESQELRAPVFDGGFFINLGKDYGTSPRKIKLIQSASTSGGVLYGATSYDADLQSDQDTLWMVGGQKSMSFVSLNASHYMFPFDSSRFDYTITFDQPINMRAVLLVNRAPGFFMPCPSVAVRTSEGSVAVAFELVRNPLIVGTAMLLVGAAAVFAVSITMFVEAKSLPQAVASYFFSLWSVRGIFGLTLESFPTFFDMLIVSLAAAIPLLLAFRAFGLARFLLPVGAYLRDRIRKLEGRKPRSTSRRNT